MRSSHSSLFLTWINQWDLPLQNSIYIDSSDKVTSDLIDLYVDLVTLIKAAISRSILSLISWRGDHWVDIHHTFTTSPLNHFGRIWYLARSYWLIPLCTLIKQSIKTINEQNKWNALIKSWISSAKTSISSLSHIPSSILSVLTLFAFSSDSHFLFLLLPPFPSHSFPVF